MKLLIITYILNIIDYIFTAYWVKKFGLAVEANPIGRWLFENNVAWLFKIVVVGLLFIALHFLIKAQPKGIIAVYILLIVYSIIILYHCAIIFSILH